jgi:putative transposase
LIGLARSSWYYKSAGESPDNLALMRAIDEQYLVTPFYGGRRMGTKRSAQPEAGSTISTS